MSVESFIRQFGQVTESYFFYNGRVELRYAPKEHIYYLVTGEELEPLDGVTTVCHIIDKSDALIPWACKMMALKLLATAPYMEHGGSAEQTLVITSKDAFETLVNEAKTAHKEKLEEAGAVGHSAHDWIEQYIKSVLADDEPRKLELLAKFPDDERARNCCLAALNWMRAHNVRWISTERKVYSRQYKYAGTMDGLCRVDSCGGECCPKPFKDRLTVADWKTSNYLYIEYLLQTAAYLHAYNEEIACNNRDLVVCDLDCDQPLVTDRWVIRLGKDDGEFDPWHAPLDTLAEDWEAFLSALNLSRAVEGIRARVKAKEDLVKAEVREAKRAAREAQERADAEKRALASAEAKRVKEAALRIKCKKAEKYKGMKPPTCNDGVPCEWCSNTYRVRQATKGEPK